jgi:hypothetical protein
MPPSIDQLMRELLGKLPHLSPSDAETIKGVIVKARVTVTIYQAELKIKSEAA